MPLIDTAEIYRKYELRVQKIAARTPDTPTPTLRRLVSQAKALADLSMLMFKDYLNTYETLLAYSKGNLKEFEEYAARMVSQIHEMDEAILSIDDVTLKNQAVAMRDRFAELTTHSAKSNISFSGALLVVHDLRTELVAESFSEIMEADESEFSRAAVEKLVKFLVGLGPLGGIFSGFETIRDILGARKRQANIANDFTGYLDEFVATAAEWCVNVQYQIDWTNRLGTDQSPSIEESVRTVKEKIRAMLDILEKNSDQNS